MRKAYKNIISLTVVLITGLNFIVPAFAQDPFTAIAVGGLTGASGAGLFGSMAGMSGIDIAWGNNSADQIDAMWDQLNPDHVYFSGEKHEANPQSDPEDIYDYINVDIGDWLSAQSDFIINFAQTHNVSDNDSGSVTKPYTWRGWQIDDSSEVFVGRGIHEILKGVTVSCEYSGSSSYTELIRLYIDGNIVKEVYAHANPSYRVYLYTQGFLRLVVNGNNNNVAISGGEPATTVNWNSDILNTGVFAGWESAKVKIPHSISQLQTGWTLQDFLSELDRIWYGAGEDQIIIEDGREPSPPVPVPDTPLGEVPFDDWVDLWGQGIYQQLENQSDALDFIGSNGEDAVEELESIDSNLDDLNQTAESIDTNIGTGIGLLGGIKSGIESAVDFLEGIAEHVGELVEEIVEGTETLIAGILNQIPSVFGVIFGPIKQASSIWHYVVEWIQSISAPMSWVWSMASGTSYYIILPVYASLAGAVVLAFYKRFGK